MNQMNFNKRIMAILTLLFVLLSSISTSNQAEASADALKDLTYEYYMVQIAPEYTEPENYPEDTPNVLYAHLGQLKNQAAQSFNGEITIPLPVETENFSITTLGDYKQGQAAQVAEIKGYTVDEKNRTLTWKPNYEVATGETYNYVLEFFYNPIKKEDEGKKSFTVVIDPQVATAKMEILIESPANSSDFKVDLDGSTATLSTIGTISNMYTYEDLKATDVKTFPVSYVKAEDKTSREKINDGEWNIPEDSSHGFTGTEASEERKTEETAPLISTVGAIIIAVSILLAAILVFVAIMYKGKKNTAAVTKKTEKSGIQKKESKSTTDDAKKKLRTQLINGEIDQETYDREISKLS